MAKEGGRRNGGRNRSGYEEFYLHLHLGYNAIEMPTEVNVIDGKVVQEWDAAFKVDDVLYLCEAKHTMSIDKVPRIPQRIKTFKEKFQAHVQEEFSIGINKIVGVACGTFFPLLSVKTLMNLFDLCVSFWLWLQCRKGVTKWI